MRVLTAAGARPGKYRTTFAACFLSVTNQAVITNVIAVLYVSFVRLYGFSGVWQLGVLIAVNFTAQIAADILLSFVIDKIPYRAVAVAAVSISAGGLILFASLPFFMDTSHIFGGMLAASAVFAFSGGMLEVVITPIVDSLPVSDAKGKLVSVLHSFYAWGQVVCVAGTALFVLFVGAAHWMYIMYIWALVPLVALGFMLFCPMHKRECAENKTQKGRAMISPFMLVCFAAILLGGASEVLINQYVSTFAKLGLGLSDALSDMAGMCMFAVMLGVGRLGYAFWGHKLDLGRFLCINALLTFVLYLSAGLIPVAVVSLVCCVLAGFTTALLWPGTLVVASRRFPASGAWIFALLAVFGDIGAAAFPAAAGFTADAFSSGSGDGMGAALAVFSIVPLLCFACHLLLHLNERKHKKGLTTLM